MVVLDGALDAARHDHRARLSADLAEGQHLLVKVIDHDLGLEPDRVVVALDVAAQLLLRPLGVELGVVLDRLDQPVIAVDRRVVPQHIQDEAFLDRLLHRVAVERQVAHRPVRLWVRSAEDFQRLVLRRRGEGEVAGVRQQLLRLHEPVDDVLDRFLVFLGPGLRERHGQRGRGAPALTRVRFVDHDGEPPPAVLAADLVEDERELLHGGDDDLLALGDERAQVAGVLGVPDRRAHLGELLDGVFDLLIEDPAVGDDDDRVEDRRIVLGKADQLVRKPGDRVRLAAARRVLDQVAPARAVLGDVGQELAHHVELVEARPDLNRLLAAGPLVPGFDDLSVIFQDLGQTVARENSLPQVVGLDAIWVRRIARAVVPAQVEGQEP